MHRLFDEFCIYLLDMRDDISSSSTPSEVFNALKLYISERFFLDKEVLYCACVLADEIMLVHKWHGTHTWCNTLLESEFFSTNHAGDEIFKRIELLLHDASFMNSALARIYARMLAIGFQGKHRSSNTNDIHKYIEQLQRYIKHIDPSYANYLNQPYDAQYNVRVSYHRERLRNELMPLYYCMMGFCAFMITSTFIWSRQMSFARNMIISTEQMLLNGGGKSC